MCLALIAVAAHPELVLIVAANRDEFHARASTAASRWNDPPGVLAGRDLVAGGTWLGVTATGRYALVTNFHDPGSHRDDALSRGQLPLDFLAGSDSPRAHATARAGDAAAYNGFNLLLGDRSGAVCLSNRDDPALRRIAAGGVHGLGNRLLDSSEPKLDIARARFSALLGEPRARLEEALFELLADENTHGSDSHAPDHPWRNALSAIFVRAPGYGTRCSTLFWIDRAGIATFVERRFDADGRFAGASRETWTLPDTTQEPQ